MGYTDAELSITFVDDEEMTRLNNDYRSIDETTDVLSFPMHEGEYADIAPDMLGDIVISAPTAQEMALQHGCPLPAVLDLLLVHGTLHLLDFDHERGAEDATIMHARTLELLSLLGHSEKDFEWYRSDPPVEDQDPVETR